MKSQLGFETDANVLIVRIAGIVILIMFSSFFLTRLIDYNNNPFIDETIQPWLYFDCC